MLGRIFTVGGYTLLSRLTGFARDIMLAAILGAGPVADAFFVALRLPNHFRAIFAEGAFNAAFVPAYAHLHGKGEESARVFADRVNLSEGSSRTGMERSIQDWPVPPGFDRHPLHGEQVLRRIGHPTSPRPGGRHDAH